MKAITQNLSSFLIVFILLLSACKSSKKVTQLELSDQHKIVFLDSLKASKAIVKDEKEGFFEKITIIDMSIQMKRPYPADTDRAQVLDDYRNYLKTDVLSFTDDEISWISDIMKRMHKQCSKISSELILPEIKLIKTHAKHYGASVYYTRENIIVIPKFVLEGRNEEAFYSTMLHELFHVYSRYNPVKQAALYDLIGFKKIKHPEHLSFNEKLKNRILTNPDGVNIAYAIKLQKEGKPAVLAMPIIISKREKFDPALTQFFDYLDFGLYEVKPPFSRMMKVLSDENGMTTLDQSLMADFFRQIKDNTNYIIHPDEIMADNFMFAILALESPESLDNYSKKGQQLIADIKRILSE